MKLIYNNNTIILLFLSFCMTLILVRRLKKGSVAGGCSKGDVFSSFDSKDQFVNKDYKSASVSKLLNLMQEMPLAGLKKLLSLKPDKEFTGIVLKNPDLNRHAKLYLCSRLASISEKEAVRDLVFFLGDENVLVASKAAKSIALNKYGEKKDCLAELAENTDSEKVQKEIIKIMGDSGDKFFTPFLISCLEGTNASHASEALLKSGDISALKSVNAYLKKMDNQLVSELVKIFPEEKQKALLSSVNEKKYLAHEAGKSESSNFAATEPDYVQNYSPEEVNEKQLIPLLKTLNNRSDSSETRYKAACSLGKIDSVIAKGRLINALSDSDAAVRYGAVQSLVQLKARDAGSRILELLNDSNEFVRSSAAHALEILGDKSMCSEFKKAFSDTSKRVRYSVMKTLAKLDLRGSVDIFRKGLEDSDEIIRISALEYIGLANDNASTDLVISLLEKSGGAIRDMCADILIKIGGYAALDPLYKVIKQVDRELLDLASKSRRVILEQRKMGLDLKTAIEAGDDQSLYLSALNAGQETGEMDFGSIIKAIDSESIFVASSAIISFAKKCSPEKGIVKLSQKIDHKSAYVRESTATALGMIGTYDAVELLEKLYRDKSSEVRFAAARSLGKILSSESRRILMKMMDDKDVHVRNAAKKSYNNICGIAGDKKMIFMGSGLTRQPA